MALFVGLCGVIANSLFFWGVFAAESSFSLSGKGWAALFCVCVCFVFSMFLCLWGGGRQSAIHYLRLLGFLPATLIAMQFADGPASGLFCFAAYFVATILLWNLALSGVWYIRKARAD